MVDFGKFFGRTISEAAAYGIGSALEKPLEPGLQELTNETWRAGVAAGTTKPLEAGDAAEIVAEDVELQKWGSDQAAQTGIGGAEFAALVQAVLNAPGVPEALTLLRRGEITDTDFAHALRKSRLETRWDTALHSLKDDRLSAQVIALAIVRGLVADPGILPVGPPSDVGNVPAFPSFGIDALTEAAASGFDKERLSVLVGINGRPMSPEAAARAYFRGIAKLADFQRAISEGDVRNEWAELILAEARQIPSAVDGIQLRLRGWIDDAGMYAQTARHGMSQADTDNLFLIHGRPPSWHQVWIGLARGGVYDGPVTDVHPAFLKSLQESDLRPEWYNLLWHSRYTYPSAFVLRALATGGDLTQAETEQILLYEGWEPGLAAKVSAKWAGGTPTAPSTHVKSATTTAITATRKAYIGGVLTADQATAHLATIGETPSEIAGTLKAWDVAKAIEAQTGPGTGV